MWTKRSKTKDDDLRQYDRGMLRSHFASLFWAVISDRRRLHKFKLQNLADRLGIGKSQVSKWFSNAAPNWRTDTIADLAWALNLEFRVQAIDRETGAVYIASGRVTTQVVSTDSLPTSVSEVSAPPLPESMPRPKGLPNKTEVRLEAA